MDRYKKNQVSVIVPIYNTKEYLRTTLDSIINQTYKNLEIILVDDGSTDGSEEICDTYRNDDSRICVLHRENGGLSAARNAGMAVAGGEFLFFIDADDYAAPWLIEYLVDAIETRQVDMAKCAHLASYRLDKSSYPKTEKETSLHVYSASEAIAKSLDNNDRLKNVVWASVYRKSAVEGILFSEGRVHEDVQWFCRVVDRVGKMAYIDSPGYFYRQRQDSVSHRIHPMKDHLDLFFEMDRTIEFLEKEYPELVPAAHYYMYKDCIDRFIQVSVYEDRAIRKEQQTVLAQKAGTCDRAMIIRNVALKKTAKIIFLLTCISFPFGCWVKGKLIR